MGPRLLGRRPDLWNAAIQAVITFLVSIGAVRLTGDQVGLLFTAITAFISLIVGQALTPNGEVDRVISAAHEAIEAKNEELAATKERAVRIADPGSASQPQEA